MYKIEKKKVDNLTIFDSKFGEIPYWDFSKEFPTDSKGEKLKLLAQINFEPIILMMIDYLKKKSYNFIYHQTMTYMV